MFRKLFHLGSDAGTQTLDPDQVVTKERPDLEEEKTVLIKQQNEFTVKLKQLEDDLLRKLAEAQVSFRPEP